MADTGALCKVALLRSDPVASRGISLRIAEPALRFLVLAAAVLPLAAGAGERVPERFDTVVIDAGHGGTDTGAIGAGGTQEKDLVLGVARELAARLRAQGLEVVMTRDRDVFVPLERRNALANDARADLFISVHANASESRDAHGT